MKQYLIELQDEEYQVIDEDELKQIEESAEKFDGFTGIRIVIELPMKNSSLPDTEKQAEEILEKYINDDDLNFIFHEKKQLWYELIKALSESLKH